MLKIDARVTAKHKIILSWSENQLLSIVHGIYANFDQHTIFSKAFDKVWHEGLLFKLEHIGIS